MNYIDYYLVRRLEASDYAKAEQLAKATGDIDVECYVNEIVQVVRDGIFDRDNLTEKAVINGEDVFIFQDHNGQGDGGSPDIANSEYIARDFPDIFKALGISVEWSKGPKVLAGQADGHV